MKEILRQDMLLLGNAFMVRINPAEIEIRTDKDGNIIEYVQIRDGIILNKFKADEVINFIQE